MTDQQKKELFEQDIKVGDEVSYSGLGSARHGVVIKRSKRTITIKMEFSTVKLSFVQNVPARDLGIQILTNKKP